MTAELHTLQLLQAERAVTAHPGNTDAELAAAIRVDRALLRERLEELERAGKAHRAGHMNTCRVTGRPGRVWFPGPDPFDSADALPPDLVNGYANALDAMTVPLAPEATEETTTAADAA